MTRLFAKIAAVLAVPVTIAVQTAAADVVLMRPGDVAEERAFFEVLLEKARADCFCDFQMNDFRVGRFDINDDGRYELFVSYEKSPFCGSAGCHNPIFHLQNGLWQPLTELDGGAQITGIGPPGTRSYGYIVVSDERFDSYRTLFGAEIGVQWSVDETTGVAGYHSFCLSPRCFWNLPSFPEAEPPKPTKRKRKRR